MNATRKTLLATALVASLAAGTALSTPTRSAHADAFLPPTAAELGMDGAQARQWDELRAGVRALRRVGREELRTANADLRELLDQPSPDLRAFSVDAQQRRDAYLAEMHALRQRQLALYESLLPPQQARVRAAMAQRLDRLAQLRERLHRFTADDA